MELKIVCQGCGEDLKIDENATEVEYRGPIVIRVEECETCNEMSFEKGQEEGADDARSNMKDEKDEAVEEARNEGYAEGKAHGYDEGLEAGRAEKED